MGSLSIVEFDPFLDDASGLEAIADLFEIDCLLLQRSPEALDEDVAPLPGRVMRSMIPRGEIAPAPIH